MRTRLWVVGLLWLIGNAPAAVAAPPTYTLADCIHRALDNSGDLKAAAADLAGARARLAEAGAGRYGQAEYNQVLGLVNRARGNVVSSPDNKDNVFNGLGPFTRIELNIDIPLWTFGKLDAALRAAQEGLESEQARSDSRRADVVLSTKQLYYSLLLTRQLSGVLHDMLDTMDKAIKKTQERLDGGSSAVTEIDLMKLKTGRAKFAKGVIEVDAAMGLTRSALARAVGVAPESAFDIADRKLEPVAASIEPLEVYLSEGPSRRPEVRQLTTGIAAQTAKVDMERSDYYPNVFVGTGFQFARAGNRTDQTNPFASDDFNYARPLAFLGMRWDLNFLTTSAKVAQAQAELDRLQALERDAASGLQLDIRRAYSDVLQAREIMQAMEEGRKAGRALLILTVSNFDLAIGEAEELFKGLGAYTEASSDYFRAVNDYNVGVAALGKAVGKELTALTY